MLKLFSRVSYASVLAPILGCFFVAQAQAASIELLPDSSEVAPGGKVTLQVIGDFAGDATLGGGLDLAFLPTDLIFDIYTPGSIGMNVYRRDPDVTTGALSGFSFGDFNGVGGSSVLIGTIVFDVPLDALPGQTSISINASNGVAGPFASADTLEQQSVMFNGVTITITSGFAFQDGFEQ